MAMAELRRCPFLVERATLIVHDFDLSLVSVTTVIVEMRRIPWLHPAIIYMPRAKD
jgi:hypothetical protein